jgi:hypothetical protein
MNRNYQDTWRTKMKKTMLILMAIALAALLAACGQSDTQTNTQAGDVAVAVEDTSSTDASVPQGTLEPGNFQFEMPLQTLLILGTFKLEDTDLAIQTDQAKELLPLWQVLKGLLESDTAAREEIDALVNQIAETMTDEQMQAVDAMGLTMQDLFALNQELGLDQGFPQAAGDQQSGDGTGSFQPPEGGPEGMPQGMGPGGGMGGGQGFAQGLSPEELESLRATREAEGSGAGMRMRGGGMLNVSLIEAVIELLQSK